MWVYVGWKKSLLLVALVIFLTVTPVFIYSRSVSDSAEETSDVSFTPKSYSEANNTYSKIALQKAKEIQEEAGDRQVDGNVLKVEMVKAVEAQLAKENKEEASIRVTGEEVDNYIASPEALSKYGVLSSGKEIPLRASDSPKIGDKCEDGYIVAIRKATTQEIRDNAIYAITLKIIDNIAEGKVINIESE